MYTSTLPTSIPLAAPTYGAEPQFNTPKKGHSKPLGLIIGLAVGVPVAIILIVIATLLFRRNRRKTAAHHVKSPNTNPTPPQLRKTQVTATAQPLMSKHAGSESHASSPTST